MTDGRPADALRALEAEPAHQTGTRTWPHAILGADALAALGRHADAARRFEVILCSRMPAYARLRLGEIYEAMGDVERAREN